MGQIIIGIGLLDRVGGWHTAIGELISDRGDGLARFRRRAQARREFFDIAGRNGHEGRSSLAEFCFLYPLNSPFECRNHASQSLKVRTSISLLQARRGCR